MSSLCSFVSVSKRTNEAPYKPGNISGGFLVVVLKVHAITRCGFSLCAARIHRCRRCLLRVTTSASLTQSRASDTKIPPVSSNTDVFIEFKGNQTQLVHVAVSITNDWRMEQSP
ncbi:unnamed protein product [Scytosiphon promiscuus]